jgi:PAS domain S-box-containing protein
MRLNPHDTQGEWRPAEPGATASALERLARLAARAFQAPRALVALGTPEQPWLIACHGVETPDTWRVNLPRLMQMAGSAGAFVIGDARGDERWAREALEGLAAEVRFLAGTTVRAPDGSVAGLVCVGDRVPHTLRGDEADTLADLGEALRDVAVELGVRDDAGTAAPASEARFRAVAEGGLDAFFILRSERDARGDIVDFVFVDVNRNGERLIRLPREQIVGRRLCDLLPITPTSAVFVAYVRVAEARQPLEETFAIAGPDGGTVWIHQQIVPLAGGIAIISRDVTARTRDEVALRQSEERFRLAARSAHDLIYEWDIATGVVEWFGAIDEHLGYAPGEIPRTLAAWEHLIHPDDRPRIMTILDEHLARREPVAVSYRVVRRDGAVLSWMDRGVFVCDEQGRPVKLIGVTSDVTARTQAEAALRFLAEASTLLVNSLDEQTTLNELARLALPLLGDVCIIDLVEPGGAPYQMAVAPDDPALAERLLAVRRRFPLDLTSAHPVARVLRDGQPLLIAEVTDAYGQAVGRTAEHEALIRGLAQRSLLCVPLTAREHVLGTLSFVTSRSGRRYTEADLALATELAQRAGLAIDNARLYEAEQRARAAAQAALEALRQSQAQLVQAGKLAAIGTLAAGVAHELNQPLMVIRGQAQLMLTGEPVLANGAVRRVERIERQTDKMMTIIDHLRAFGRTSPLGPGQQVGLNQVVHDALLLIGTQMRERNIMVRLELAAAEPVVLAEANEAEQVVLNLLVNARDAVGQDGEIVVRTGSYAGTGQVRVTDTGEGLAAAVLGRLFEPFFTTKEVGQGTGLGLSISRDIARRWSGDLTLDNRRDGRRGAVAVLTLPLAGA